MKRTAKAAALGVLLLAMAMVKLSLAREDTKPPLIQLAVLLDTSNSMDGLIDQAKSQLWSIVNEFATAERDGRRPELQVALYEYGKSSLPAGEGHIRMIAPLTTDLDRISEELFALKTNGGNEYCGWVISDAVRDLKWSDGDNDYRAIFIAGNEPFTQGKVNYRTACQAAARKGIVVNTIHCGEHQTGISGCWKDGALLAGGSYMHIDHNSKPIEIAAPQDKELVELGKKLNDTYIAFGKDGEDAAERQKKQDDNSASVSTASAAERTVTKASKNYRNEGWDLIDAVKHGKVELEDIEKEELPEEMQEMSLKERKDYIEQNLQSRARIQKRIQELNGRREAYIAEQVKERPADAAPTLDQAVVETARQQAEARNFKF